MYSFSSNVQSLRLQTGGTSPSKLWSLCDTEELLDEALATTLSSCQVLALDCEGDHLGQRGGLSPLSLSESLKRFFALIECESVQKIVYDGRMDFCAFFYECGVRMRNVIDLQLADILSRSARGQSVQTQNRKLHRYLDPSQVIRECSMYEKVHMLGGMASCLKDHVLNATPKGSIDHQAWLRRPIQGKHLSYAAYDIELIELIHNAFQQRGYIKLSLSEQSERYITIWSDIQPQASDNNLYRSHPLLPLEILVQGSPQDKECNGCKRKLSRGSFPPLGSRYCFVCHAVQANMSKKRRGRWNGGRMPV
ncbi:hypothetical protein F5876DRAFT_75496 [Lentinula aff. lateritia]|uniref:Uncharacterized protein n=1 Tax=Lentinula aff. lateritia TaxID=2804960 RepID=A0ACC1U4T9_9AGAR|nr:hypothetical protein F5876DRAFT_75496 [Lentinula aff. lateritia]